MEYKIMSFSSNSGELFVFYENYKMVTVPLPLTQQGLYVTGEELDIYLKNYGISDKIRYDIIEAGVANESEIMALCVPIGDPLITPPSVST